MNIEPNTPTFLIFLAVFQILLQCSGILVVCAYIKHVHNRKPKP